MAEGDISGDNGVQKHGFRTIAIWQSASFLILLLLIWLNEIWDLSSCTTEKEGFLANYFGAILLSLFVILTAIISIGQTYLKQKNILSGFITVCSHCHKIRIRKHAWEAMEHYIADRCPVEFSHGLCPTCFDGEMAAIKENAENKNKG